MATRDEQGRSSWGVRINTSRWGNATDWPAWTTPRQREKWKEAWPRPMGSPGATGHKALRGRCASASEPPAHDRGLATNTGLPSESLLQRSSSRSLIASRNPHSRQHEPVAGSTAKGPWADWNAGSQTCRRLGRPKQRIAGEGCPRSIRVLIDLANRHEQENTAHRG